MFTKSAELYDLIYSTKDYKSEADTLRSILLSLNPQIQHILDAACGTAEHHRFLTDKFEIDGFDLNEDFIQIAKSKNPGARYFVANMVDFDLKKQYDAVVCLFSSIGYLKTVSNLYAAISNFRRHLTPDGVLVIEPWISPEDWNPGQVHLQTYSSDDIKVCRMAYTRTVDQMSLLDFEYLVGTADGIQKFDERHELGLFDHQTITRVFTQCGLTCQLVKEGLTGRGLYIGTNMKRD
ncbi:MAG: class I SAM-dependent methyltransferase [Bacteroidota bacterium]